jgi:UDP-N-acetyl-2-amino-2-deoxyglucuronate dehydrogenase
MQEKKIHVAIVGCGRIAEHHCRAVKNNPNLELTAVCDIDFIKATKVGTEFGIPFFGNYRVMLESLALIDVVAIITPSGMHFEHSKEVITKYKKSIVIEKPTVLKPSELVELQLLAKEESVKIFPVFQNRFNKAVQRVKQGLKNGELGDLRLISIRVRWCRPQKYYDLSPWRGTYAMDGGCMTNQGIHHIDLLRYLGGDVAEVNVKTQTMGADIEVEDVAVGSLKFKNNALGTIEITTAARPIDFEASISIVGSNGLAQIGGIAVNELQIYTPDEHECKKHTEDFSDCVYGNGHKVLYDDIYNVLISPTKEFIISNQDNLGTIKLLNSLYVSDEVNNWVKADSDIESKRLGKYDQTLFDLYRLKS